MDKQTPTQIASERRTKCKCGRDMNFKSVKILIDTRTALLCWWLVIAFLIIIANYNDGGFSHLNVLAGLIEFLIGTIVIFLACLISLIINLKEGGKK
jgi:hypothetical protein